MNGIGFSKRQEDMSRERVMKGLRDFLRPEFMARVDEIVAFAPLTEESYAKIAKLNLEELRTPLEEKGLSLEIAEETYSAIAKKAFGGKFGGRDIRRVIRSDIEDKIAELLIDNSEKTLTKVVISAKDGEIVVTVE